MYYIVEKFLGDLLERARVAQKRTNTILIIVSQNWNEKYFGKVLVHFWVMADKDIVSVERL